jgi:hypothetical protein
MRHKEFTEPIKVNFAEGTAELLDQAVTILRPFAPETIRDRSSVVRLATDFLFRSIGMWPVDLSKAKSDGHAIKKSDKTLCATNNSTQAPIAK